MSESKQAVSKADELEARYAGLAASHTVFVAPFGDFLAALHEAESRAERAEARVGELLEFRTDFGEDGPESDLDHLRAELSGALRDFDAGRIRDLHGCIERRAWETHEVYDRAYRLLRTSGKRASATDVEFLASFGHSTSRAPTVPLAICLAALAAMEDRP